MSKTFTQINGKSLPTDSQANSIQYFQYKNMFAKLAD